MTICTCGGAYRVVDSNGVTDPANGDRVSARQTPDGEGRAWDIWFPNGARVRYVWDEIGEEIVEKTYLASDPDSAHNSWGVQGDEDELADYALETLQEFTQTWRDDPKACAVDMPDLFAAVVCYEPPRQW